MNKDRGLKAKLLRLASEKIWFTQLELVVTHPESTAATPINITDVDVFSLIPNEFVGYDSILMDCKSGSDSPISRALWLSGLMQLGGAARGLCVLGRDKIELDHRMIAAKNSITLIAHRELDKFLEMQGVGPADSNFHTGKIEAWETYHTFLASDQRLHRVLPYLTGGYWKTYGMSVNIRQALAGLMQIREEFDPAKSHHHCLLLDLASLIALSAIGIVNKVIAFLFVPENERQLDQVLKHIVWGGHENYRLLTAIKAKASKKNSATDELSLNEWPDFVQLIQALVQHPHAALRVPFVLRELGFASLANDQTFSQLQIVQKKYPHSLRLAIAVLDYVCKAAYLPREFFSRNKERLLGALSNSPAGGA